MLENRSREYYLSGYDERVEYAERLWQQLVKSNNYKEMESVFTILLNLFNNALMCFEYGLFLSSALTCRVVIEGSLYMATANENIKIRRPQPNAIGVNPYAESWNAAKCTHLLMDLSMDGLRKEALEQKLIDQETSNMILTIQEKGNIAAHYTQRQAKIYQRWLPKRASKVGIDQAIKEAGQKYVFDPAETKIVLETTTKIMINIIEGTYKTKVVNQ